MAHGRRQIGVRRRHQTQLLMVLICIGTHNSKTPAVPTPLLGEHRNAGLIQRHNSCRQHRPPPLIAAALGAGARRATGQGRSARAPQSAPPQRRPDCGQGEPSIAAGPSRQRPAPAGRQMIGGRSPGAPGPQGAGERQSSQAQRRPTPLASPAPRPAARVECLSRAPQAPPQAVRSVRGRPFR